MNGIGMIRMYLKEYGYDGLYSEGGCACERDDLHPCDEDPSLCTAGYKVMGCQPECGMDCDWHIMDTPE